MRPDKIQKKIAEYTVVIEPAEEGGYIAYVPALPGCATQGETLEEVFEMVKDAVAGYLVVLKEVGQEIPVEKSGSIVAKIPATLPA